MNMYDKLGITNNGRINKETCRGLLMKMEKGAMQKYPFRYSVVRVRQYEVESTIMPSTFIHPTETIRTSRLDLPFAKDDKVQMHDGRIMTVSGDITYDYDDNRSQMADGRIAWIITLSGGAGSGNAR